MMGNKFDPMTGKLIQEPQMRFDPMTGKPIQEPQMRFDPMTGEPIREEQTREEPQMRFDPMTGKPIREEQTEEEPQMRFDPMTGQPIAGTGFDPMTGQPIQEPKKKRKIPVIGAIAAGVAAVVVVAIAGVASGAFLSKPMKVLLAAKRTFSDQPKFVEDIDLDQAASMLDSGKYKLSVNLDTEDVSAEGAYISTDSEKQLCMNIRPDGDPSVEVDASLNESQLKIYVPEWSKDVYVWNYKEGCDGFIEDVLDRANIKYEDLSDSLSRLYSPQEQEKHTKELAKDLLDQIDGLEWKKADRRTFDINGKSRKAKGYQVTITQDDAKDFLNVIEEGLDESLGKTPELYGHLFGVDLYEEFFDGLYDEIRDMEDMNCTFYIYRNRLAAIQMEQDDFTCELLFKGGDFRMQNMELEVDDGSDSVHTELIGGTKDSRESYELSVDSNTILELEYDKKSGHYEIVLVHGVAEIEGEILSNRSQTGISVDMGRHMDLQLVLSKDAALEKLPDKEVDIMDMSTNDWIDLFGGGWNSSDDIPADEAEAVEDAAAEDAI